MRVVVVGDVAHVIVVGPSSDAELAVGDLGQRHTKSVPHVLRRFRGVGSPHDHGHETDLTVRNPAVVVPEISGRDDGRFAEVAARAHFSTVRATLDSFFTFVPATGLSDTTLVHVGFGPAPGPVVL